MRMLYLRPAASLRLPLFSWEEWFDHASMTNELLTQTRTPPVEVVINVWLSEYFGTTCPVQRTEKPSVPRLAAGVPPGHWKSTTGSLRANFVAVRFVFAKYAAAKPDPASSV